MGFSSQDGYIGLRSQAEKGTYADPGDTDTPGIFVRHRSGAMGGNRELLIPDPEIGGNRDIPDAQLGPIAFAGEFEVYPRMESIPFFLKGALGIAFDSTDVGTGGDEGHLHEGSAGDGQLPWISIEEDIAGGYEAFQYTDVRINTLHLEAEADNYLMGTVGLIGLTQGLLGSATDPEDRAVDTSPLLVGSNILVSYGGEALPAKSFSLDLTNNMEDDDFRLGSFFLGDLTPKRRELTLSVTIRPEDSDLWRQAMWGSPSATQPLGQSYKDDVEITIITYESIPGTNPAIPYEWTISIDQAIIAPFSVEPSGDDILEHDLEVRAVRPNPFTDSIFTTSVLNGTASVN